MTEQTPSESGMSARTETLLRVRLPGFIGDEEIGLGDAIKRATYAFGLQPCGGCDQRATALNRWISFSR
jgi:hypothetical protein